MSREIVAFGLYFGVLAATSTAAFFNWMPGGIRAGIMVAAVAGLAGVFCSAMIYADTRRDLWLRRRSVPLFFLTTILLGAAVSLLVGPTSSFLISLLVITTILKIGAEILVLRHASASSLTPMKKSALLVIRKFQPVASGHLIGLAVGGIGIPVLLSIALPQAQWLAAGALLLLVLAELGERYLFFRCVVAPKMPGGMK
jgi:formate dehydrogenase iron-sulfur subunit